MSGLQALDIEVYWQRLMNATDEAAAVLVRTAFSQIARQRDLACCIFDREGRLLAQDVVGTPGLAGCMPGAMRAFLAECPATSFEDGDGLITNDPWKVAGHKDDVTLLSPIFWDGELAGFAMCLAHKSDIGGARGLTDHRDVFEEGLWLPVVKFVSHGQEDQTLLQVIRHNSRTPDEFVGDLRAQLAANDSMTREVHSQLRSLGRVGFHALGQEIRERSARSFRRALEGLPHGRSAADMQVDHPRPTGSDPETLTLRVVVDVSTDGVVIDFTGTSPQVDSAINACLNGLTTSYAVFAIKSLIDPFTPMNDGFMSLIKVTAPQGCLYNPRFPAPVKGRTDLAHMIPQLVYRALAPAAPDKVIAASGSSPTTAAAFFGVAPDGRTFAMSFVLRGGYGGSAHGDGVSSIAFPANTQNNPVEVLESSIPVMVERKEFEPDSAGAGRHRGGFGEIVRFRALDGAPNGGGSLNLHIIGGRFRTVAGAVGGRDARVGSHALNGVPFRPGSALRLSPGDLIEVQLPGGGGHGDPSLRDPELVARDVRSGLVSVAAALDTYRVVVDPSGHVDEPATAASRAARVPATLGV